MKVQISTKNQGGKKKINQEFGGEWLAHVEAFGFKIVEHAGGESHGMTMRMQPAFDDFDETGLFPKKEREKLVIYGYNLSKFGEKGTDHQAQDYHAFLNHLLPALFFFENPPQ